MEEKIKAFAEILESQQIERLKEQKLDCEVNILNAKVFVKPGKKYIKVNIGGSGKYMIDQEGNIFGIKGYGVINKKHHYGNLDTIGAYYWGNYKPIMAEVRKTHLENFKKLGIDILQRG